MVKFIKALIAVTVLITTGLAAVTVAHWVLVNFMSMPLWIQVSTTLIPWVILIIAACTLKD